MYLFHIHAALYNYLQKHVLFNAIDDEINLLLWELAIDKHYITIRLSLLAKYMDISVIYFKVYVFACLQLLIIFSFST